MSRLKSTTRGRGGASARDADPDSDQQPRQAMTQCGMENDRSGAAFLVLTAGPTAPPVRETYEARPADLHEGDQWDGGLVRVARVVGSREAGAGAVAECVLEVDE